MTRPFYIPDPYIIRNYFSFSSTKNDTGAHQSIYDFNATTLDGAPFHFADLKGKTILVVNTASNCGFTPQFESLEALYRKYADRGLVIVGFPCNQFGGQEPGGKEETEKICFAKYDVTFPMMEDRCQWSKCSSTIRFPEGPASRLSRKENQVELYQVSDQR